MSTPLLRCAAGVALALAAPAFAGDAPSEVAVQRVWRVAPAAEVFGEIGVLATQTQFALSSFDYTQRRTIEVAPPWRLDEQLEHAALDLASAGAGAAYRF